MRLVATDVRGEVVPECGHFIPEEAPDFLNAQLLAFLD
jgi:pimeloyl-ACP methyl ester carboxylesterase